MADQSLDDADNRQERKPSDIVEYWKSQLGAYDDEFKEWVTRSKKIVRRYRDERQEKEDGTVAGGARFNALWSNVQTLQPALYIKAPQPVVERRFLAKDPLARVASMTLERACEVQIEVGKLHPAMRKAVMDYLLSGRGTVWERYEPTYGEPEDLGPSSDTTQPTEGEEKPRPVTYEKVATDYVAWDKFRHSPASIWEDVWWVSKDEMLTRKELRKRFKAKNEQSGKLIADEIPLRDGSKDKENDREKKRKNPRALVVEIWNKRDREVIFIAPDYGSAPLEIDPDPLSLDGFWPCPAPLYATITNDLLVPVPDYAEYQDQADELDNLTARIKALTDAVRVNGVYDASIPELKRILQEGDDNRMIGVKNWAELTTKGGLAKAMDFVPLADVVAALLQLYDAFDRTKAKMDEINGLSDIVRGQSSGPAKTATEQRIKGQFASLRLEDRKKEVGRFARDTIAIKAEIIAEQFSPEILSEMTGMLPFIQSEIEAEMPPPAPPMALPPQMGHNGGPPMNSPPPGASPGAGAPGGAGAIAPAGMQPPMNGAPVQPPMPPPPDPKMLAQQRFDSAVALLKDDKMRTFRIDIETDSTVEPDKQAAKEAVVEMFTAIGGFLEKALPIGQAMPKLVPALGQSILFAFRTFGAGRDVEGMWEQAIDEMTQLSKNPPPRPPSPEQIKAQAEQARMQGEMAQMQAQAQLDQAKGQQDMQLAQSKNQMEIEKMQAELQIKREELNLRREEYALKAQEMQTIAAAKEREVQVRAAATEHKAAVDTQATERQAELSQEADTHGHDLAMQTMEAKAKMAQKPQATV